MSSSENDVFSGYPAPVHHLGVIDSTNALALEALANGAPEGSLFIAEAQRRGRGQRGNVWHSPPGGHLYLSMLLRPRWPLEHWGRLTLCVGVLAAEAIHAVSQQPVRLKWPNDLILHGAKLGGVLCEARLEPPAGVVVGLGVNISGSAQELGVPERRVITLAEMSAGRVVEPSLRLKLAAKVATAVLAELGCPHPAFSEMMARWRRLSVLPATLRDSAGKQMRAIDVSDDGQLIIQVDGALRQLNAASGLLWEDV
ncbi:MAG: biotin--[acetyl-CoA-carboxylase] ligase [Myxococcota bacterium]|jgi:BirA family biotin operon repressor/biotin-[acetyl-CoA-carboxylase] ligase|nr:biotin--[acetyl-CoA-carboxylase] ligase [Myxococcota bacterium]